MMISLRTGRSGVRIAGGIKRLGRVVDHLLHLLPRLRMDGAVPLFPLYAFMVWIGTSLFTLYFKV